MGRGLGSGVVRGEERGGVGEGDVVEGVEELEGGRERERRGKTEGGRGRV